MIDRPVRKDRASVDKFAGDGAEDARVIGADTVIAHDKIHVVRNAERAVVAHIFVLRGNVRLVNGVAVDIDDALANLDAFSRKTDDALDERFRMVERIPENDDVATMNRLEAINKFVDEDALLIGEEGRHAGTFNFYRLIEEDDDDEREANSDQEVAGPNTDFVSQGMRCRRRRCWSCRNRWG